MNFSILCELCVVFVSFVLLKKWNTKDTKNHEEHNGNLNYKSGFKYNVIAKAVDTISQLCLHKKWKTKGNHLLYT
jgi:hypothetical protein